MNYTLEKIYKAKDVVKNRTVPLGFSIWPDIKFEDLNQYYFFYDGNAQVNLLPKNIFAVKNLRNKLENDYIELTTKVIEAEKSNIPYTNKDKFAKMMDENPHLETLRLKLGLDPDY